MQNVHELRTKIWMTVVGTLLSFVGFVAIYILDKWHYNNVFVSSFGEFAKGYLRKIQPDSTFGFVLASFFIVYFLVFVGFAIKNWRRKKVVDMRALTKSLVIFLALAFVFALIILGLGMFSWGSYYPSALEVIGIPLLITMWLFGIKFFFSDVINKISAGGRV